MIGILRAAPAIPLGRSGSGALATAVAAPDEDAVTLAVAAAESCLGDMDRERIDALFVATGSGPYEERSTASLVSRMLSLRVDVRTVDFGGSSRAGISAWLAGLDLIESARARLVLVLASETRLVAPEDPQASRMGDGAVALLLGEGPALARAAERASVSGVGGGPVRLRGETAIRPGFPERGYAQTMAGALKSLFSSTGVSPEDFDRAILDAPDGFGHFEVGREFGFLQSEKLLEAVGLGLGHTGCAHPLMLLLSVLERSRKGRKVLLAACGDGADAVSVEIGPGIEEFVLAQPFATARKRRHRIDLEEAARRRRSRISPVRVSGDTAAGEMEDGYLPFRGCACEECESIFSLPLRICPTCGEKDGFRTLELGRTGIVYSLTREYGHGEEEPTTLALLNLIGGGRVILPMTDLGDEEPRVGGEVEVVLRRIYDTDQGPVYHYKARPAGGAS